MLAKRVLNPVAAALSPLRRPARNNGNGVTTAGKTFTRSTSSSVTSRSVGVPSLARQQQPRAQGNKGGKSGGSGKKRGRKIVGAIASVGVAAALAREGLLPEVFFEWDDQVEWEEVHHLAQMSNMTNKPPSHVRKWFDRHGYSGEVRVRDLPEASSRYWIHTGGVAGQESNRVHHVAVRGTVSLSDLKFDLKTRLVMDDECGCRLHAGFKEVADAIVDDIEQFLEEGVPVKLTGHSLGGAVAVIVAMKLKARGSDVLKVMTFGAPKVTDALGAERLRDVLPVLRVTHERDPVPLMPLASWDAALAKRKGLAVTTRDNPESRMLSDAAEYRVSKQGFVGDVEKLDGEAGGGSSQAAGRRRESRFAPSTVYSHFGSQVVLVQRQACLECRREASISPQGARFRPVGSRLSGAWDDIWGPDPVPGNIAAENDELHVKPCGHCPSRGRTYYDPTGDAGCVFDKAWRRLANVQYTHRMNSYEKEVEDRRNHHVERDNILQDGLCAKDLEFSTLNSIDGAPVVAAVATSSTC